MEDGGNTLEVVHSLVLAVIPILTTVFTNLFRKVVTQIPSNYLPIVAAVVGAVISVVGTAFEIPALQASPAEGVALGLTGSGLYDAWNRNITKRGKSA